MQAQVVGKRQEVARWPQVGVATVAAAGLVIQPVLLIAAALLAVRPSRDGTVWRVLRLYALLAIVITGIVYGTILARPWSNWRPPRSWPRCCCMTSARGCSLRSGSWSDRGPSTADQGSIGRIRVP